ncbi:hypothetical protein M3Y99_01812500 [Aphelenchoides fujianensis]|nr:hypothetical protein M3Y99_01812500 [Aphelenchoides fujianensis]
MGSFFVQMSEKDGFDLISTQQRKELELMSELLTPFLKAIDLLQSENICTSSLVFGKLKSLIRHCEKTAEKPSFVSEAAAELGARLHSRFDKFLDPRAPDFQPAFVLAALMDPTKAFLLDIKKSDLAALLNSLMDGDEERELSKSLEDASLEEIDEPEDP